MQGMEFVLASASALLMARSDKDGEFLDLSLPAGFLFTILS